MANGLFISGVDYDLVASPWKLAWELQTIQVGQQGTKFYYCVMLLWTSCEGSISKRPGRVSNRPADFFPLRVSLMRIRAWIETTSEYLKIKGLRGSCRQSSFTEFHGTETPHSLAKKKTSWATEIANGQGLKQQQGIDKSNSDPFIKQHEGQLQVRPNQNNQ